MALNQSLNKTPVFSPIFQASLKMVAVRIKELYKHAPLNHNKNIDVVMVGGVEGWRKLFQDRGTAAQYPFFTYMLQTVERNHQSYNAQALRHMGINAGLNPDGQTFSKYYLTPVIANLGLTFLSNSDSDVHEFVQLWLSNDKLISFELENKYNHFRVGIRMMTDQNISIPEADFNEGLVYTIQTQLSLETYTGYIETVPTIKRIHGSIFTETEEKIEALYDQGVDVSKYGVVDAFDVHIKRHANPEL